MALQKLKIGKAPKAFARYVRAHNDLVEWLAHADGKGGIKILVTDAKLSVSVNPATFPVSAILPGYREKTIAICESNVATNYVFLVRTP